MLNKTVKLLADELAAKDKIVEPVNNSALALVNGVDIESTNIVASKIANKIGNEVSLYRNSFLPVLKDYNNIIAKTINDKTPDNPLEKYEVISIKIPGIIKLLMEKDIIKKKASSYELPIASLIVPAPSENIKSYFKVTSIEEQLEVDALLGKYSDEQLTNLWEKYLSNVSGSNDNISSIVYNGLDNFEEISLLLILVGNLKNNIPEGISVKEDTYGSIMREFYNKLIEDISVLVKTYRDYVLMKRLVIKVDNYVIKVVDDIYNVFLKDNSVEVLLGMVITKIDGFASFMLNDIIANSDTYTNNWEKHVRLNTISMKMESKNIYRLAYTFGIDQLLKDIPESLNKYVVYVEEDIVSAVEKYVNRLDTEDLLEIPEVALYIIGKLVFPETNAYRFFSAMNKYKELDNKLTPKEAASLATLDMIVDYLLQQVRVK